MLQFSFTRVTMTSDGDVNFPEYKVQCKDFEPLAASDTAESSLNSDLSEQLSDAGILLIYFLTEP